MSVVDPIMEQCAFFLKCEDVSGLELTVETLLLLHKTKNSGNGSLATETMTVATEGASALQK